jgi:CopG family nickel-responsive transcriptional regulator
MDNVTRIGVSLEPELLERFDDLVNLKGYETRSEAIRDLIREALIKEKVKDPECPGVGTITLVYEHHKGGVSERLMEIQHQHHQVISSSIHVHLDLDRCLEVLVVKGTVGQLQALADELGAVKGVLHGDPVIMAEGVLEEAEGHEH